MNRAAAVVQKIMYALFEFCINYWGIKFLRVWILLQDLMMIILLTLPFNTTIHEIVIPFPSQVLVT